MLYLIVALFAGAAVLGLIVATAILSKQPQTPKGVVFGHGALAATGLGLLIYYAVSNPTDYPQTSLIKPSSEKIYFIMCGRRNCFFSEISVVGE